MTATKMLVGGSDIAKPELVVLEGVVVSWLPDSGLGFFETEKRHIGFKRASLESGLDKKISIGTRVVGEVNSSGFAVKVSVKG